MKGIIFIFLLLPLLSFAKEQNIYHYSYLCSFIKASACKDEGELWSNYSQITVQDNNTLPYNFSLNAGIRIGLILGEVSKEFILPIFAGPLVSSSVKVSRLSMVYFEFPLMIVGWKRYFLENGKPTTYLSAGVFLSPVFNLNPPGFEGSIGWDIPAGRKGFVLSPSVWALFTPVEGYGLFSVVGVSVRIGFNFKI